MKRQILDQNWVSTANIIGLWLLDSVIIDHPGGMWGPSNIRADLYSFNVFSYYWILSSKFIFLIKTVRTQVWYIDSFFIFYYNGIDGFKWSPIEATQGQCTQLAATVKKIKRKLIWVYRHKNRLLCYTIVPAPTTCVLKINEYVRFWF